MATIGTSKLEGQGPQGEIQPHSPAVDLDPACSITACQRCRDQKLKCSRERPICTRCRRLGAECLYPSPPTRRGRRLKRMIRAPGQRARPHPIDHSADLHNEATAGPSPSRTRDTDTCGPHRNNATTEDWAWSLVNGFGSIHDPSHSYPTQLHKTDSIGRGSAVERNEPPLPPRAIGLSLLEIYFTRIYNASLLFYKPLLFQNYLDGKLPDILLKAIFALSTLFLSPSNQGDHQCLSEHSELKVLSSYHSCGLPWAKSALREAMPLMVEEHSLMAAQALECLQLYWLGIGDTYAGNLCLGLAYNSCSLLGYNKKLTTDAEEPNISLEGELQRRCFWACWISTCIVAAPEPYITSAWKEAAKLPLPALITDTPFGYEVDANEQMSIDWCSDVISPQRPVSSPVAAALLVKIVGVWAKVQLLITEHASVTPAQTLGRMQRLSNLATSIFDQAKPTDTENTYEKDEQIMLCFNALFHQCQITLHSIIVPVFSGKSTSDGIISRETIRKSAEKVVHHAHSYATLLSPYLYAKGDITHVPPLVGYGAFIAAMVLLTMEVSWQDISLQTACPRSHRENERLSTVEAILGLLDALRKFWRPLQYPYEKLSSGLQTARSTSQAHRGTAATESGASARHSMRRLGRRSSPTQIFSARPVPVEINSAAGGEEWDSSVHHSPAQTTRPLNGTRDHLANTSEGTGASEIATRPAAARDAHSNPDPSGADDGSVGSPFMAPFSDVEDAAWYSLSFAEAGIEQFAGFEPLSLFQQGWRSFS